MSLRRSARVRAVSMSGKAPTESVAPNEGEVTSALARKKSRKKQASASSVADDALATPTPPRKRQRTARADEPPKLMSTATPSAVRLMTIPYSSGDIDDATPPPVDRDAEPHRTNAPLVSPETSRLVAYSNEVTTSSPSKSGLPKPTTTTRRLLEDACAHLMKVDPKLKTVIDMHPCRIFSPEGLAEEIDPFRSLVSGIMAQQVP